MADTLSEVNLAAVVEGHPADAPMLVSDGEVTTYGELRRRLAGVRGALLAAGVRPGDRVALVSGNSPAFVVGLLAALGAGAAVVPLNPLAPPAELARQLTAVAPVAAVLGPGVDLPAAAQPATVLHDDGAAGDPTSLAAAEAGPPAPLVERGTDDPAVLLFTSGTAGLPRAAVLTHGNLLANVAQIQAQPGRSVSSADVALGVLPLFHVFGLTVNLLTSLADGASLVLVPRFAPAEALTLCERHRVTVLTGVPPMFAALAAASGPSGGNPLASVRLAVSAGPLPDQVLADFQGRFSRPLYQGYGLTEAAPVVTTSVLDGDPRPGSVGVPLPGVELRLVDADGEEALVGDPGEVWVRGPNVFAGYWQDPEATARVLTVDGWLRTGDLGVLGDDGNLQLVDRAKDLIIVNGFNVVPAEVEAVLGRHPEVGEVAVVGVPSRSAGESVKAVVVPAVGAVPTLSKLAAFAACHLARYKCPTSLQLSDSIPRGPTGKVLRRQLR